MESNKCKGCGIAGGSRGSTIEGVGYMHDNCEIDRLRRLLEEGLALMLETHAEVDQLREVVDSYLGSHASHECDRLIRVGLHEPGMVVKCPCPICFSARKALGR